MQPHNKSIVMGHKYFCMVLAGLLWLSNPASADPLTVVVISDLNGSYGSTDYSPRINVAIEKIIEINPDLVIATGDLVAGQRVPRLSETNILEMWAAFHATVSDPLALAGIPLAVTPGNHDASNYSGFSLERRIFERQWLDRKPDLSFLDDTDYPFFYGFDLDGVRFVSLDATVLGPLHGDQMDRLAALTAGNSKLEITFSHLPLWAVSQQREREIIGDDELAQLYTQNNVGIHLSGHHHAFYPAMSAGVAYVAQACLGGGARRLIGDTVRSTYSFTVLEITSEGTFDVYALHEPDFTQKIDLSTLPSHIVTPQATLTRLDLARP